MRASTVAVFAVLLALGLAGCRRDGADDPSEIWSDDAMAAWKGGVAPSGAAALAPPQRGGASYYADSLAGGKTASGERYQPAELTAAHRTLPFGTVVEVQRKSGQFVRVRINDRGPFVRGKIIDLSRAAAKEIDLLKDGVADVTLWIVERPPPKQKKGAR
jgi:rare lipoprotein A